MIVTITQYGNRYDITTTGNENKLHVLNQNSLTFHLKHVLKLSKKNIAAVFNELQTTNKVCIERVAA